MIPAQAGVTGTGILPVIVTFLLVAVFYAVTLHLAASFYIGDVPTQRAAKVGPILAAVSLLLGQYGRDRPTFVLVVVAATLVADLLAASFVYRLSLRSTVPLVLLHFAFATVLGFALANLFGLL